MISKNSFIKIMDALRDYWDALDLIGEKLNINMDDNFMTRIFDDVIDALIDDVEIDVDYDNMPMIMHYAFECDFGRNEVAKMGDLTSAAKLYDYIMLDNQMENHSEEFLPWR